MIGTGIYLLFMLAASIGAGCLGAMVGIGGGLLIVPILLSIGVPVQFALGASIVSVIGTSSGAASAFIKDRMSNFKIGTFLNAATTSGAVTGAVLSIFLIETGLSWIIYLVFGTVLITSAYDLYLKARKERRLATEDISVAPNRLAHTLELEGDYHDIALDKQVPYVAHRVARGFGVMLIAGLLAGLLGLGSGTLKVVGMDIVMKLPFKVSTTTSNFMIGVTAAASAGIFFLKGYVDLLIVAPVAVGVVAGSFMGSRLVRRARPLLLRVLFVLVLIVAGIEMFQKGLISI